MDHRDKPESSLFVKVSNVIKFTAVVSHCLFGQVQRVSNHVRFDAITRAVLVRYLNPLAVSTAIVIMIVK